MSKKHPIDTYRLAVLALCALATSLWLGLLARPAEACGGLVYDQHEARLGGMSGQEVVLLVTPTVSRLIVSAGYVDSTDDFAFLVPVGLEPDEVVDGDPRLFYALEEGLAPRFTIADGTSGHFSDGGGCGCGGEDLAVGPSYEEETTVVVVQRGQTDTYDYVIVGGTGEISVAGWLTDEGFAVPADYAAAIDGYVTDGWLFLAARVRPGTSEGVLSPLELAFPGSTAEELVIPFGFSAWSLPPGEGLGITLYIFANMGVEPANYAVSRMPAPWSEFDAAPSDSIAATSPTTSNYNQFFDAALAREADGAFVLEARTELLDVAPLTRWLEGATAAGRVPSDLPTTERTVADFEDDTRAALGGTFRIARLRTRLAATQLRDLELRTTAFDEVSDSYYLYWNGASTAARDDALQVAAFWAGLVLIALGCGFGLRRRVRARRSSRHCRRTP